MNNPAEDFAVDAPKAGGEGFTNRNRLHSESLYDASTSSSPLKDNSKALEAARRASQTLQALIAKGGRTEVRKAAEALETLKAELEALADVWAERVSVEMKIIADRNRIAGTLEDLEKSIIDTKLAAVCAMESRDNIAHDLNRARKELDSLLRVDQANTSKAPKESVLETTGMSISHQASLGSDRSASLSLDQSLQMDPSQIPGELTEEMSMEARIQELEELTKLEMARIQELNTEIVQVTDDTINARKRREQLQVKLAAVSEEL